MIWKPEGTDSVLVELTAAAILMDTWVLTGLLHQDTLVGNLQKVEWIPQEDHSFPKRQVVTRSAFQAYKAGCQP